MRPQRHSNSRHRCRTRGRPTRRGARYPRHRARHTGRRGVRGQGRPHQRRCIRRRRGRHDDPPGQRRRGGQELPRGDPVRCRVPRQGITRCVQAAGRHQRPRRRRAGLRQHLDAPSGDLSDRQDPRRDHPRRRRSERDPGLHLDVLVRAGVHEGTSRRTLREGPRCLRRSRDRNRVLRRREATRPCIHRHGRESR